LPLGEKTFVFEKNYKDGSCLSAETKKLMEITQPFCSWKTQLGVLMTTSTKSESGGGFFRFFVFWQHSAEAKIML